MMDADTVIIDMKNCDLTVTQVMEKAGSYAKDHPGYEVFLDGDRHAIVARRIFA